MKKCSSTLGFISISLILLCLIGSCKKPSSVSACIGTLPSAATVGYSVTFTSCTSGASAYSWSFGDGGTATGAIATHTYTTAGMYSGSLTVTSGSSSSTKGFTVNVVNNNWAFKGSTFTTDSVFVSTTGASVSAVGSSGGIVSELVLIFPSLPTVSNNYTVININNAPPVGNQVYAVLYNNLTGSETIYGSTGSGNLTASVTVSGGKISVSLPTAVEMSNQSPPYDSTSLSATITQTQ